MILDSNSEREFGIPKCVTEDQINEICKWIEGLVDEKLKGGATSITSRRLLGDKDNMWYATTIPIQYLYVAWSEIHDKPDTVVALTKSSFGMLLRKVCENSKKYSFKMKIKHGVKKYYLVN